MAEDHGLPFRVSDIKDPAVLFESYNTEQIRRIERKVRGEIEQKKEELRQMVGERYRDLIDAADTIGEMRQCSESVVQSIQDMHQYCLRLKQGKNNTVASKQEVSATVSYLRDLKTPGGSVASGRSPNLPRNSCKFLFKLKTNRRACHRMALCCCHRESRCSYGSSALKILAEIIWHKV